MDEDLLAINQLKAGGISGLQTLVERYQAQAVQAAVLIVRDPALAEDIVQEAFLQAHKKIGQFDDSRPFKPWFLRIVINAAIKRAGRQRRSISLDTPGDEKSSALIEMLEANTQPPEDGAEQAELLEQVQAALWQLSPDQRAVIVKRYLLGMSDRELADELDCPPGTVRWRLSAARRRLRGLLSFSKE
jgi:RNA polymerase sigma-70 factor, ECF subfamily